MKWGLEIAKWIYVFSISAVLFLFFCLFLDLFCLLFFGWNPLVGPWPIFSGTISVVYYGHPGMVFILCVCLAAMARIMLGKREPFFAEWFQPPSSPGSVAE